MDIPGRSVDATLNIQAKTTGLSETAESLTEVRDALSEVAAVSEAAEQQLDGVNDELSRSETEASTAAGGFTALAASMATASQAAESLDDNLDDIDGASVDAFLPTPGDVDDRVRDIEDRISDIDSVESISIEIV
jgi:chromosome segregation ATPase